jgi:hypothetical protein
MPREPQVPDSLKALAEGRIAARKDDRADRFREAEAALGRPVKPWEVDRIGLRSDGTVVMYDRPVQDPNRRRVSVHPPRPPEPERVLVPAGARPRERRDSRRTASRNGDSGDDDPHEPGPPGEGGWFTFGLYHWLTDGLSPHERCWLFFACLPAQLRDQAWDALAESERRRR